MKENETLTAEKRSETGKSAARLMRRTGYLPAVVYGHGEESRALRLKKDEVQQLLGRISVATTMIDLRVDGEAPQRVLIREVQRHPFRDDILHLDFFQVRADEAIRVEVPVHLEGKSVGVEAGGILQQIRYEIAIECLPDEIPEAFTIDVSALDVGDSIHIGDVDTGGVEVLDEPDLTLCTVVPPTVLKVEEEVVEEVEVEEVEGVEPEEEAKAEADKDEDEGEES